MKEKLQENPEALQAVLFFLASNGVDLQALLAGDTSQLSDSNLMDKFKVKSNHNTKSFYLIIIVLKGFYPTK